MRSRRGTRLRASGRLRAGERRRRLNAAAPKPGEVVLLDLSRRRSKGVQSRGDFQVEFGARAQFSADMDVRKLVHAIRVDLGNHFRASLLAGQRADGKGPLPDLKRGEGAEPLAAGRQFALASGFMAEHWLVGPIRGGSFAAKATLKPNGRDGRSFMINNNLRRGIDFQSIGGTAADVIRRATEAWLRNAVPASGSGVGTPAKVPLRGGVLSEVERG